MNLRVLRVLVPVLAVGAVLASCTGTEGGKAGAETTTTAAAATTTTESTGAARPRELKVDGVDPCKLLTADQMAQLKVTRSSRNDTDIVKTGEVPTCEFRGDLSTNYGVAVIADKGIDYWTGKGNTDVSESEVAGFAAKQISLSGVEADCAVAVDVADGQQLYVDFLPVGSKKPSKDEMCRNVAQGAEFALTTLQTLK
ncbi:DUF3558 domain-containing protein [Actinosynnema sp. CS-041913]|uniref:DUF3558 domain-containing protein n=1 Tax=Actinosynnema sp. CS-041913 TaxID=3239917 RepID=UPI003D8EE2DA